MIGTALAKQIESGRRRLSCRFAPAQGERTLRIAGTVTEYIAGGMAATLNGGPRKRLFNLDGVDVYMVTASLGQSRA